MHPHVFILYEFVSVEVSTKKGNILAKRRYVVFIHESENYHWPVCVNDEYKGVDHSHLHDLGADIVFMYKRSRQGEKQEK
jgi:hypothetical protein